MAKTWSVALATGALLGLAGVLAVAEDLETGRQAFRDGEYLAAFRVLQPLAREGSPEAQFLIGKMFLNGHTVPEDPNEAALLFGRAAKQGHAEAQFALSGLLSAGLGVEKDDGLAARWNRKAADQGHGEAQLQMGYRCDLGQGVPRDPQAAASWYLRAAENGAVDSNLGLAYCSGSGIEQDLVAGYFWLSVYLEAYPTDNRVREVLSFCVDEMVPGEFEQAQAKFAEWRDANKRGGVHDNRHVD